MQKLWLLFCLGRYTPVGSPFEVAGQVATPSLLRLEPAPQTVSHRQPKKIR